MSRFVRVVACLFGMTGVAAAWGQAVTTTTLAVTSAGNAVTSVPAGSVVTLTVTVKAGGAAVNPGQVNFCDASALACSDIHLLGVAQLTGTGTAVLKLTPAPGPHKYKAVFDGNASAALSASPIESLAVGDAAMGSSTYILASGAVGNYTLTATVSGAGSTATPTGQVSFLDTTNGGYVLGSGTLSTTTGFHFATSYQAAADGTSDVKVVDLNGDGKLDIVAANHLSGSISILLGNGDGTFQAKPSLQLAPAYLQLAVADFNGDGIPDIAVANGSSIAIFLGKGDGTFAAPSSVSAVNIYGVVTGDFNGDGIADLAAIGNGNTVQLYFGNGDGTFRMQQASGAPISVVNYIVAGDFNGDGITDLAMTGSNCNGVVILLGTSNGTFQTVAPQSLGSATATPDKLVTSDFDGDGKLDLAIVNTAAIDLVVLHGNGDGTFSFLSNVAASAGVGVMLTTGDFNGDNIVDFALMYEGDSTDIYLFLGNGDGTFRQMYVPGTPVSAVGQFVGATGDFNSDGLSDIAAGSYPDPTLNVFLAENSVTTTVTGISVVGTGTHYVDAVYTGDSNFPTSTSRLIPLTAEPEPTSTVLVITPSPGSWTVGQMLAMTATVAPDTAQDHDATGTVTFLNNGVSLGTGTVSGGVATFNTTSLPIGNDCITAVYGGDANFASSNTDIGPICYTITGDPQTITFPQPASQAYVDTSVVLDAAASSGLPVTYRVVSGPAVVSGSVLTYTGVGTVVVEADQAGNSTYAAAAPVQRTVTTSVLTEPVGTSSVVVSTVVVFGSMGTVGSIDVLTQGAAGLDFNSAASPGGCAVGTTYAAGQYCTVNFTFKPTRPGQRYGGIVLSTSAGEVLANSYVYGLGTGPQVGWLPGTQSLLGSGFSQPSGVATDGNGNIYVSEYVGGLGEITAAGVVKTVGTFGITTDVTVDGSGNLIVTGQYAVYEVLAVNGVIPASPTVITLASGFSLLNGVAVDGAGDVFLANGTGTAPDGAVYELLAVNGSVPVSPTVRTLGSGFNWPSGVAVDAAGDVYTSDAGNKTVYEMMAVNGSVPASSVNIRPLGSGFDTPSNVALDAANDVYLTDSAGSAVYEIEAVNGSVPATNPTIVTLGTGFSSPEGMEVDSSGNVFFADFGKTQVVKLAYSNTPTLNFATTAVGSTSSDSPQMVTLFNNGNAPLLFAVPAAGNNPGITTGFTIGGGSTCPQLTGTSTAASLAPGGSCTDLVSFTPVAVGPDSGQLVTTDNALNVAGATQTVLLNGTGSKEAQTITFVASASPVPFGAPPVTLNATASSGLPVTFSVLSGPGTVNGNVLTFTGYGTVVVAANQAGNAIYSAAPQVTQIVVVKARAAIALSATPNPVFLMNPVALTASVSAPDGSPTGSVLFLDGSTAIGTAAISGGVATINVSTLTLGTHSITAIYSGDSSYAPITSTVVVVTVEDFAFTMNTPNVTIFHGGTATYTLTLTTVGGVSTASVINFSVAGEPDNSEISFTPQSVPAGSGTTTVTMAIHTPNYPVGPWNEARVEGGKASKIMAAFAAAGILLLPFARRRRMLRARMGWLGCVLLLAAVATSLSGCGSGWKTQEWAVNVTATSGQLSHTATGTLTSECSDGKTACPVENQ